MTVTYDIITSVGQVRLKIGDTDTTDNVFTDEEITYFLGLHSSNINLASADALESWAAKYGQAPSTEAIGGYSYSQTIIFRLMQLSKRLRDTEAEKVATVPIMGIAEMNLTGEDE